MPFGGIEIDLQGPQGNAFFLMGLARGLSQRLGLDFNSIEKDMKSSDYEHLLQVMEQNFGELIIMYRAKEGSEHTFPDETE